MSNNDYIYDRGFFAEDIAFEDYWRQLTVEQIDEIISTFPGKQDFVDFYLAHNGGIFTENALLYTDDFYENPADYRLLEVDGFLHIPLPNDEEGESFTYSIEKERKRRTGHSDKFDEFVSCHIPFANDAGDNTYWINIETGKVKFMEYEYMGYDADKAITVAHSFYDFCKRLRIWE